MTVGTDARAVAARLDFERVVDRVERVDPATSGRLRLEAIALGRRHRARSLSADDYAAAVERLTADLRETLRARGAAAATPAVDHRVG